MKIIIKTRFFKPVKIEDKGINILVYELVDEKWSENIVKTQKNLLDKLLFMAQNTLSIIESSGELRDKYVYVEVEYPGLKASRGDGGVKDTEVIVFPTPQPLKTIIFFKKENNELKEIYRIDFKQEKWIFESVIKSSDLDYDAILVESIDSKRIILREELLVPFKIHFIEEINKKKRRRVKKKSPRKRVKRKKRKTRSRRSKSSRGKK